MHSALPTCHPLFMVRSLQLVEVRPYAEEEEEGILHAGVFCPVVVEVKLCLRCCAVRGAGRSLWSQMITWLSFAINIVMLATWSAQASLADTPIYDNDTGIPESLTKSDLFTVVALCN